MKKFWNKHHYRIITTSTIVILLVFSYQVMAYLFSLKEQPEKPQVKVSVRSVLARTVSYEDIKSPVTADGRVVSTQEIVLSSEVRGKILEGDIPFKKGQQFKKNNVLIKIYDKDVLFTLKSRKSGFLQKIAGIIPDIKVDYPDSYATWMDFFKAIDINNPLPELPQLDSEQEKIFVASRSILTDYFSIKSDEINYDKHVIRAPFQGSFTDVTMEAGAIANPGAVLARIIRTDKLELEVPVKSENSLWIERGDEVDVTTGDGSMHWKGKVIRKSDFVNIDTQSISVFISIVPTKEKPLYSGEYLKAVFPGREIKNVMEIPRNAVFNSNEVYIVENGKLAKANISIKKINEKSLLFSGLEKGTELVVEPLVNVLENSSVEIMR